VGSFRSWPAAEKAGRGQRMLLQRSLYDSCWVTAAFYSLSLSPF